MSCQVLPLRKLTRTLLTHIYILDHVLQPAATTTLLQLCKLRLLPEGCASCLLPYFKTKSLNSQAELRICDGSQRTTRKSTSALITTPACFVKCAAPLVAQTDDGSVRKRACASGKVASLSEFKPDFHDATVIRRRGGGNLGKITVQGDGEGGALTRVRRKERGNHGMRIHNFMMLPLLPPPSRLADASLPPLRQLPQPLRPPSVGTAAAISQCPRP